MSTTEGLKTAQDMAVTAQTFAIIALVTLTVAILHKAGLVIADSLFPNGNSWQDKVHNIGVVLIELLPAYLFFESVNKLRKALSAFSTGDFFNHKAADLVADAGSSAIYASVALIFAVPNLLSWMNHQGGFTASIEPEYLGMLAFAIFVCMVGKILTAATDLKSENDAFV